MNQASDSPPAGGVLRIGALLAGAGIVGALWAATSLFGTDRSGAQSRAVVEQLYAAFGKGDMAKIRSLIAPDATWVQHSPAHILPFAGPRKGPDGVIDFFKQVDLSLKDPTPSVREFIVSGDKVAVPGFEESTVRETGVRYKVHNLHLFTVRDGKIVSFEEFIDSAPMVLAFTHGRQFDQAALPPSKPAGE